MKSQLFRCMATLLLAALLPFAAHAENRPEIGPQVKAYSGEEGVKVWLVRVGPRAANQALVQVTGIDHDWNQKIQKMDVQDVRDQKRYALKIDGKPFVALLAQSGSAELYLPGDSHTYQLFYDESLSSQGNAEHFLTDYLQQPQ
ncbi:MAG: hypothetical protein GAK45_01084 [Pseudomonas citronellolis]|nr:MAG: hypothetical protein GAK45_01084 [Pseudomonas citronellolis]